jgi:superfamily II DNA or RNA helicase
MISEGVDIPRMRVGIYASNVNTEMYFRQFCGRFVRTQRAGGKQHAYVYLPDDPRLRELASRVTRDVRAHLKATHEFDELAAAVRVQTERGEVESRFAGISAHLDSERVLDYGPLFNPLALLHEEAHVPEPEPEPVAVPAMTRTEEKESSRRALQALVSLASTRFRVEHRRIHATLNQRFGGPIASATAESIDRRRQAVLRWLENNRYDGLR